MKSKKIFYMNIFMLVCMFIQTLLIARLLGVNDYGTVTAAMSLILLIQNVIGLRTGELILNFYNKTDILKVMIFKKVVKIEFNFTLITLLLCFISYFFLIKTFNVNGEVFLLSCLIIPSLIGFQIMESVYTCEDEIYELTKIKMITQAFFLCFVVINTLEFGLYGYLISLSISNISRTYFLFTKAKEKFSWNLSLNNTQDVTLNGIKSFTIYSYLSSTFKSGVSNVDVLLLSKYAGSDSVGIYKIAKNLAAIPGSLMSSMWATIFGQIVNLAKQSKYDAINKLTLKYSQKFIICGIFLCVPAYLMIDFFVPLLYGTQYNSATLPLKILLLGNFLAYALAPYNKIFYLAKGRADKLMYLNCFNFLFIFIGGIMLKIDQMYMAYLVSTSIVLVSLYSKIDIFLFKESHE